MPRILTLILAGALLASAPAQSQAEHKKHGHEHHATHAMIKHGALHLSDAWARATPPRAKNAAAYITIKNTGHHPDRLIAAHSPVAAKTELHTHSMKDGVMRMHQIDGVNLAPGGMGSIKPGGDHVMLMGLKHGLKEGTTISLVLTFEKAGDITLTVPVMKKAGNHNHMHKHKHKHTNQ